MKSPYVNEVQPNQTVTGVFLVTFKDVRQKKSGDPYLSLTLADRSGDIDAKMWDNVAEVVEAFERDSFVKVRGLVQVFQNKLQMTVHKIQLVPDHEVEAGDFYPASKRDRNEMFAELQGWITHMTNPHLKGLLNAMFADEVVALAYRTAPAAKSVHHGWIGGLIEHVLSLCKLAHMTAAHYEGIDFDLLLTGVILHDTGQIRVLNYARGTSYSDEGQLIGHINIGVGMVYDALRQFPDFPPRLRDLVVHLILSHHGAMEYGSPKVPMFAEALLLHHLDNLDSKMEHARSHVERDRLQEGSWSSFSGPLERTLLKKDKYLNPPAAKPDAEKPAPPKPVSAPDTLLASKLLGALDRKS